MNSFCQFFFYEKGKAVEAVPKTLWTLQTKTKTKYKQKKVYWNPNGFWMFSVVQTEKKYKFISF